MAEITKANLTRLALRSHPLAADLPRPQISDGVHLAWGLTGPTGGNMAAHPIRLLLADVDGTLVDQDKVLTRRAIAAAKLRRPGSDSRFILP